VGPTGGHHKSRTLRAVRTGYGAFAFLELLFVLAGLTVPAGVAAAPPKLTEGEIDQISTDRGKVDKSWQALHKGDRELLLGCKVAKRTPEPGRSAAKALFAKLDKQKALISLGHSIDYDMLAHEAEGLIQKHLAAYSDPDDRNSLQAGANEMAFGLRIEGQAADKFSDAYDAAAKLDCAGFTKESKSALELNRKGLARYLSGHSVLVNLVAPSRP
jgi:hypothetical protein